LVLLIFMVVIQSLQRRAFAPFVSQWACMNGVRELTPAALTPENEEVRLQLLCNLGKEMRPKCLLKDAFYCHSERSEESWLGLNPGESNETRRKTSKAA
jgi:hypothetical protein